MAGWTSAIGDENVPEGGIAYVQEVNYIYIFLVTIYKEGFKKTVLPAFQKFNRIQLTTTKM